MQRFARPSSPTSTTTIGLSLFACLLALVALVPSPASATLLSIPLSECPCGAGQTRCNTPLAQLTTAAQIFDPTIERQTGQTCLCVPAEKVQSCELAAAFAIVNDLQAKLASCGAARDQCFLDRDSCRAARDQCFLDRDSCRAARDECFTDRDSCRAARDQCFVDRDSCRADRGQCIIDRDRCRANC